MEFSKCVWFDMDLAPAALSNRFDMAGGAWKKMRLVTVRYQAHNPIPSKRTFLRRRKMDFLGRAAKLNANS